MNKLTVLRMVVVLECVIMAGMALHAPLSVWLGTIWPHQVDMIKAWKEIIMGVCLALLVVEVTRQKKWRRLFGDIVIRLVAAYGVLHLVLLAWYWQGVGAAVSGELIDLRYILFFVLVYVTMQLAPSARRPLLIAAGVSAVIVIGFAVLQVTVLPVDILSHIGYGKNTIEPYLTVDKNTSYIRINSTLRGPNPLGAYAAGVLAFIAAFMVERRRMLRAKQWVIIGTVTLGSSVALWVSYSRSALVAGVIAVAVVLLMSQLKRISHRWWVAVVLVVVLVVGGLFAARNTSFVSNVVLHNNPKGGSATKSDQGHVSSLESGISLLLHEPLGGGIGSTGSASLRASSALVIEDQYLFIAHEAGWLGLVVYLVLFGLIMVRTWRGRRDYLAAGVLASGVALATIGVLLPVWVDDTVSITWWGLAAIAIGGRYERKTGTRK